MRVVELHYDTVLERCREMHTRGKRYTVTPGMEGHRNVVRRCKRGDFSYFGNTAGARHVGLDEVDGAADDKIFEGVASMQVFADRNRGSASLTQNRVAFDVFDKKRLFEPIGAAVCEGIGSFERDIDTVALVGVRHYGEILAQLVTHRTDDADILIEIEADFDLDPVKTLLGESARPTRYFGRLFGVERGGVNRNFLARFAAKKLIDGKSASFPEYVPQRDIDPAQSNDADAAAAEFFVSAAYVGFVPDRLDISGIYADDQRLDHFGNDQFNKLAVTGCRADARNTFIGLDSHQGRRARIAYTGTAKDLPFRRNWRAQANRLNVGKFHRNSLHLPELPLDDFAVHHNEINFFVQSLVSFGIDPHHFRFVAFFRIDPKQRQRYIPSAGKIVIMILRQHDAFASVEHGGLVFFVVESRLAVHHNENMIFAGM